MKQHFTAVYEKQALSGFYISAETEEGSKIHHGIWVFSENSEITRACINRIVDNLNKLAEHNAKNGGINEV